MYAHFTVTKIPFVSARDIVRPQAAKFAAAAQSTSEVTRWN
jgi:hypothetical protein